MGILEISAIGTLALGAVALVMKYPDVYSDFSPKLFRLAIVAQCTLVAWQIAVDTFRAKLVLALDPDMHLIVEELASGITLGAPTMFLAVIGSHVALFILDSIARAAEKSSSIKSRTE